MDDRSKNYSIPKQTIPIDYIPLLRQVYSQWFKQVGGFPVNHWLRVQPEITIYPNFVDFPFVKNTKRVVVVHDTAFIEQPTTLAKRNFGWADKLIPKRFVTPNLWYLQKYVPSSLKRADVVVAVSEETRASIAGNFGINLSDISVVPNAVGKEFFVSSTNNDKEKTFKTYGLPKKYILFLGTIEPRKNVLNLLDSYALLPKSLRDEYPLVLAGKPGWNNEPIYQRANELKNQGHNIMLIGFVADKDLSNFYQGASCFVFPSIHEGFGLPILEAMAAQTPVITSNLAPMNRLAEDAAVFIDPYDPKDISMAIEKVLGDGLFRKKLIERGSRVASKHTWESSAKILLEIVKELGSAK